jgi:hypothetical protein
MLLAGEFDNPSANARVSGERYIVGEKEPVDRAVSVVAERPIDVDGTSALDPDQDHLGGRRFQDVGIIARKGVIGVHHHCDPRPTGYCFLEQL